MNRVSVLLLAISTGFCVPTWGQTPAAIAPYLADAQPITVPVGEPSGLAFHEKRGTILLVDDEGTLVELDLDLKEKNRWKITGDLEGIAVHPDTGTVFMASEREGTILEFDLDLGKVVRTIALALGSHPEFQEDRDPNRGVEGLAFVPGGDGNILYAVHEKAPARLVRFVGKFTAEESKLAREADAKGSPTPYFAAVEKGWDVGLRTMNDLCYDVATKTFLVTGAKEKTIRVLDASAKVLRSFDLPGPYPEGFCLLPNGDALVVHDSGGGHRIPNFRKVLFP